MADTSTEIRLAARPSGEPAREDFELAEVRGENIGKMLVRVGPDPE